MFRLCQNLRIFRYLIVKDQLQILYVNSTKLFSLYYHFLKVFIVIYVFKPIETLRILKCLEKQVSYDSPFWFLKLSDSDFRGWVILHWTAGHLNFKAQATSEVHFHYSSLVSLNTLENTDRMIDTCYHKGLSR